MGEGTLLKPRFVPETVVAAASSARGPGAYATPILAGDIRFEELQRAEPDTALAHLPVHVGDTLMDEAASGYIGTLYTTGFSQHVRIAIEGDVTTPRADSAGSKGLLHGCGAGPARFSPIGPLKSSRDFPHKKHNGDQYQNFRFQLGTAF